MGESRTSGSIVSCVRARQPAFRFGELAGLVAWGSPHAACSPRRGHTTPVPVPPAPAPVPVPTTELPTRAVKFSRSFRLWIDQLIILIKP